MLADGRVVFVERNGAVKVYDPPGRRAVTWGEVPVAAYGEVGMMGLVADPDSARTGHLTNANTNDLRGKVLRVRPRADGGCDIPDGNLFPGGKGGRPEIYAMGCRNPFRVSTDPKTGWVYWGGVGPNGYDEVNQARRPGNFGWPMFVGPNEAYRDFDFATRTPGAPFDAAAPVNGSRNNTGAKDLPPPVPALTWYPSCESDRFPGLGSGGRAAVSGTAATSPAPWAWRGIGSVRVAVM